MWVPQNVGPIQMHRKYVVRPDTGCGRRYFRGAVVGYFREMQVSWKLQNTKIWLN